MGDVPGAMHVRQSSHIGASLSCLVQTRAVLFSFFFFPSFPIDTEMGSRAANQLLLDPYQHVDPDLVNENATSIHASVWVRFPLAGHDNWAWLGKCPPPCHHLPVLYIQYGTLPAAFHPILTTPFLPAKPSTFSNVPAEHSFSFSPIYYLPSKTAPPTRKGERQSPSPHTGTDVVSRTPTKHTQETPLPPHHAHPVSPWGKKKGHLCFFFVGKKKNREQGGNDIPVGVGCCACAQAKERPPGTIPCLVRAKEWRNRHTSYYLIECNMFVAYCC